MRCPSNISWYHQLRFSYLVENLHPVRSLALRPTDRVQLIVKLLCAHTILSKLSIIIGSADLSHLSLLSNRISCRRAHTNYTALSRAPAREYVSIVSIDREPAVIHVHDNCRNIETWFFVLNCVCAFFAAAARVVHILFVHLMSEIEGE